MRYLESLKRGTCLGILSLAVLLTACQEDESKQAEIERLASEVSRLRSLVPDEPEARLECDQFDPESVPVLRGGRLIVSCTEQGQDKAHLLIGNPNAVTYHGLELYLESGNMRGTLALETVEPGSWTEASVPLKRREEVPDWLIPLPGAESLSVSASVEEVKVPELVLPRNEE